MKQIYFTPDRKCRTVLLGLIALSSVGLSANNSLPPLSSASSANKLTSLNEYSQPNISKNDNRMAIKGKVIDESGDPLPSASVSLQSSKGIIHSLTDKDGNFSFIPQSDDIAIIVGYTGYKKQKIKLEKGRTNYSVQMEPLVNSIKDVVVTGIFNKPKVSYTGAATIITKDEIERSGNRNILKTLATIDPSFDIQERNLYGSDPNKVAELEIRGSSSIGSVVDLQNNARSTKNLPLFLLDGFEITEERLMDMNQADIESVVILKDASATAVYGSRGANGVVVISSVKPKAGKLRVSYSAGLNLEIPDLSSYKLLNSKQKLDLEQTAGLYTTTSDLTSQFYLDELYNTNRKAMLEGVNTNWMKLATQTGVGQYHKIDIGGGDNQFRYILNGSYNQITGAMKGSSRDNFNGGMTISYLMAKVRFTNNLTIGFNKGTNNLAPFSSYVLMNPYWSPYGADGKRIKFYETFGSLPYYSEFYNASLTDFNKLKNTTIRENAMIDWDILQSLKLNVSVGFNSQIGGTDAFTSPSNTTFIQNITDVFSKGTYTQAKTEMNSYQVSSTLSYGKVFGKHSIFAGFNGQIMESNNNRTSIIVAGFSNDKMTDISNANSYVGNRPSSTESTVRSVGVTGTFNYNFADKYYADMSYRLDGASSFGSYSRFAPFWSLGTGWSFSNEKFIKDKLPFITLGKLRYSYGVTGSLNFEPYQALMTYVYGSAVQYKGLIGATVDSYGNSNLKWQNTFQHNFGLDMSLFDNYISVTANYYQKNTDNLISDAYLPYSHGYSTYKENFGEIRNTGYDWQINVNVLRLPQKDISISVFAGTYHNTNKIIKLSDAIKLANQNYGGNQNSSDNTFYEYREGQSLDELYVLDSPGVDAITGEVLYRDTDGRISTSVANMHKIPVGTTQPKINGRFGTFIRFKGLSANVNFGFRVGGKKLNKTLLTNVENANAKFNLDPRALDSRWTKTGDITGYKSIANQENTLANSRFVFTENTLTLNNVNLSYDLPHSIISKLKMERLSFSATMSDVFYISNIEQARGTDYPYSIKPSFTMTCTF